MIRLACIAWISAWALAQGQGAPPKHRFLAVDNGNSKLLLVDEIANKGWTISIPAGSRDLQLLPGNKVLVSHGNGAAEYDLTTGAKGWSVTTFSGISTARRLENGNTLLGATEGNSVVLYEIAPDKSQKGKRTYAGLTDLRLMRPVENGNILLGLAGSHKVVEVNATGVVWTATLTDKAYSAVRLPDGHTVATSGEDCRVYKIAPDGKSTLVAGGLEKFPNSGFLWFSGFEILANGHYFVANWKGHDVGGKGPHAMEFDAGNNLVWQWDDPTAASTVTNVLTFETVTTALPAHPDAYFRARGPGLGKGFRILSDWTPGLDGGGGLFLPDGRRLPESFPNER